MTEGVSELTKLSERSRTILKADRRVLPRNRRAGRVAQPVARAADGAVARLDPQRHVGPGAAGADRTRRILRPGRLPTQLGLRLFVDGLLEVGDLTNKERRQIEAQIAGKRATIVDDVLREAGEMISGLSHCAGVVLADKQVTRLKHIEFVLLEPGKALVVLVGDDQTVENRIINLPQGLPPSALIEAANYLNAHVRGLTMGEARAASSSSCRPPRPSSTS